MLDVVFTANLIPPSPSATPITHLPPPPRSPSIYLLSVSSFHPSQLILFLRRRPPVVTPCPRPCFGARSARWCRSCPIASASCPFCGVRSCYSFMFPIVLVTFFYWMDGCWRRDWLGALPTPSPPLRPGCVCRWWVGVSCAVTRCARTVERTRAAAAWLLRRLPLSRSAPAARRHPSPPGTPPLHLASSTF